MTTHLRGTPIYCAPELLTNPFQAVENPNMVTIAQPSRKTDLYAFAILAWELLTQAQPFGDVRTEGELCTKVHKHVRPPLNLLPKDTPLAIVNMIDSCWKTNRNERKTAVECVSILQYEYLKSTKSDFDIYFTHAAVPKLLLSHIYHYFIRLGYRVCGSGNVAPDENLTMMKKSKVVIVCYDKQFQTTTKCMKDLKDLKDTTKDKCIFTLVIEEKLLSWASEQGKQLCGLGTPKAVDIGHIGRAHWDSEEGPDASMLVALVKNLDPLKELVKTSGLKVTYDVALDTARSKFHAYISSLLY